ncbi:MAG: hypothetical protein EOO77_15680 [Oxalobacteraceae bacterium]|nr:MAG: hypothetical protein EOO77_15680 [Oxalobacteraceae bacterium]
MWVIAGVSSVMVPHGKWSPKPPSRRMLYYADPYKEPFKAFLDSEDATGCWDSASDMRGIHYYFSDPNTAFGFKVRFG